MKKAIVLSSGGVDSTTCVSLAVEKFGAENVSTVSIFYGQKHDKEIECARKVAEFYNLKHYEFDFSSIMKFSNCSLLSSSTQEISHESYGDQISKSEGGKVSTYVPFRNGLMLSACAALAQSIYENDDVTIYIGAHGDDSAGNAYADCSVEFIETMSKGISIGTYGKVCVEAPFCKSSKVGVVKKGIQLKTPYNLTWSCYEGGEKPCGKCGTCIDRQNAFEQNGIKDPALD